MNNTNQLTDSLHHELERNVSELEKSAPKREENRLKLTFLHIFDGISSSGEAIEQLMKASKGRCPLREMSAPPRAAKICVKHVYGHDILLPLILGRNIRILRPQIIPSAVRCGSLVRKQK